MLRLLFLLEGLERIALVAARMIAICGLILLLGYAVLTLADGSLRSLANRPIDAVRDFGGLVAAIAVACCIPLACLQRSNITIRFMQLFFGRKIGQIFDAFAAAAVAATMVLIAWRFFVYVGQAAQAGDITFLLNIPVAPFWFVTAVLLTIAAMAQCLLAAIELARCFVPPLEPHASEHVVEG
jgi:TRAP-type C4-dicarboxylate transport system permease small subunit